MTTAQQKSKATGEQGFVQFVKGHDERWRPVKIKDRSVCPECHKPLPKATGSSIDYAVFLSDVYRKVECKHTDKYSFNFNYIKPNQVEELDKHPDAWVFISIGGGRVNDADPLKRRAAFLIPWPLFTEQVDAVRGELGMESMPLTRSHTNRHVFIENFCSLRDVFPEYELVWEDGRWTGKNHEWNH